MSEQMRDAIRAGAAHNTPLADVYKASTGGVSKLDFYRMVLSMIETGEIPNLLVCCCGHDCARCKVFRATVAQYDWERETLLQDAVAFYQTTFGQQLSMVELHCLSGNSDEMMAGCLACPFMACCKEKGLRACRECHEYPCRMLAGYEAQYVNKVNQV